MEKSTVELMSGLTAGPDKNDWRQKALYKFPTQSALRVILYFLQYWNPQPNQKVINTMSNDQRKQGASFDFFSEYAVEYPN